MRTCIFIKIMCWLLILLSASLLRADAHELRKKKVMILDMKIENDIGVENAQRIATRWLTDSVIRMAPDLLTVTGRQAAELARLRRPPQNIDEISPSAARVLMKSIQATHALGGEVFIWNDRFGIVLRMMDLSKSNDVRVERGWVESVNEIPQEIESLARLIFSADGKTRATQIYEAPSRGASDPIPKKIRELLKKHPDMVYVPGGKFLMGNNNDSDADNMPVDPLRREGISRYVLLAAEKPEHSVYVEPFLIDKYEVTNADYKRFRAAHDFAPEHAKCPVTGISWHDARAYAEWAGKRLPTEEEWEKAARGEDGRKWPWGNVFIRGYCNLGTDIVAVGNFKGDRSPYGAYDMAGNVQEWTVSDFTPYPGNSAKTIGFDSEKKVIRGSHYGGNDFLARCSMRFCALPGAPGKRPGPENYNYIGFRCVMDVD